MIPIKYKGYCKGKEFDERLIWGNKQSLSVHLISVLEVFVDDLLCYIPRLREKE